MSAVAVLRSSPNPWAETLFNALQHSGRHDYSLVSPTEFCSTAAKSTIEKVCIYAPPFVDQNGTAPDLFHAEATFRQLAQLPKARLVLTSSALLYGISPARQAFVREEYSPRRRGSTTRICDKWIRLEELAQSYFSERVQCTTLRPVTILPSPTVFSKRLLSLVVPTLPGHDPAFQVISLDDLVDAIVRVIDKKHCGTFNVAPDGAISLSATIRLAGNSRLPIPRTLQRLTQNSELLDYFRYPWTVSNARAKGELGFAPKSSTAVLQELGRNGSCPSPELEFDDFGMDRRYIEFYGKTLFRFLSDFYWRIELTGLEHVPREGRAVLAGMHRGFMPWDGVMALHLLVQKTGRYPRFLTHPGLLKFPFLANFMTKLGGVVACQESADRVLASNELLGVFPEGIHGAFTSYRQAYQLREFGRDAFVKIALRNRAPIVPFVTVGSAEIFPIFGKIRSKRWTHYTDWPCVPLTPTFPLLPIPLPSKWHTKFLAPLHIEEQYPPEAERDTSVVKAISLKVRIRMQQAIDEMLGRRRSIFFGAIFQPEADS